MTNSPPWEFKKESASDILKIFVGSRSFNIFIKQQGWAVSGPFPLYRILSFYIWSRISRHTIQLLCASCKTLIHTLHLVILRSKLCSYTPLQISLSTTYMQRTNGTICYSGPTNSQYHQQMVLPFSLVASLKYALITQTLSSPSHKSLKSLAYNDNSTHLKGK